MRLLVLGGGGFLGFHVAAAALRAGHDVTVASRSGEAPLDGAETTRCGARARRPRTTRSRSARWPNAPPRTRSGCSTARSACCASGSWSVRDPSDRFTWWPVRLARALAGQASRTVLAPGDPSRAVQYSDARDIAAFAVHAPALVRRHVRHRRTGPCPAAGGRPRRLPRGRGRAPRRRDLGLGRRGRAAHRAARRRGGGARCGSRRTGSPRTRSTPPSPWPPACASGPPSRPPGTSLRGTASAEPELAAGFDPTREAELLDRCATGTAPTG